MLLLPTSEQALAYFGTLVVLASATPSSASDETEAPSRKGLRVFVSKKGARIRLFRELPPTPGSSPAPTGSTGTARSEPGSPVTGQITIIFEGLREVDDSGSPVSGQQGGSRHSIDSLGNLEFLVAPVTETQLPNSNGIVADCVTVEATTNDPMGHFKVMIYIPKGNGTVTLDDEKTEVREGQLKFALLVDRWQWCDSACTSGKEGRYLDVDVNVKIPPGRTVRNTGDAPGDGRRPKRFSLGGDALADFSEKVNVDGNWTDMAAGYPKLEERGANHFITLRLPRFMSYIKYDPTVEAGYSAESKGSYILQSSLALGIITSFMTLLISNSPRIFGLLEVHQF